jgi:hypothetical protein
MAMELLNLSTHAPEMQGTVCDYTDEWQEYRRLRLKMFLVWLSYVPAVGAIAAITYMLFHTYVPAMIAAVIWMIWFIMVCGEFSGFSCPRCGAAFAGEGMWHVKYWIFSRKCQSCGLKKYSGDSSC